MISLRTYYAHISIHGKLLLGILPLQLYIYQLVERSLHLFQTKLRSNVAF